MARKPCLRQEEHIVMWHGNGQWEAEAELFSAWILICGPGISLLAALQLSPAWFLFPFYKLEKAY